MVQPVGKPPARAETKGSERTAAAHAPVPFEGFRREVDRLFEDFDRDFWRSPFRSGLFDIDRLWRREAARAGVPAADILETKDAYQVTVDLPGMDEKNVEVKLINGELTIKGEKHEERDETKDDYRLQERYVGTFERRFTVPEHVQTDKIDAHFRKGVLTITLPKKAEAIRPEKKIEIKST